MGVKLGLRAGRCLKQEREVAAGEQTRAVRVVKSRKVSWAGRVACAGEKSTRGETGGEEPLENACVHGVMVLKRTGKK
jgi:hypothetical protein